MMKILFIRFLVSFGLITFFQGTSQHFEAQAKENGSSVAPAGCGDTMGGRSGGCGKST